MSSETGAARQFQGCLDRFDPPRTVFGWAIDCERVGLGKDIIIEIALDGQIIAKGPLTAPRPDIVDSLGYLAGFAFTCDQDISDEAFAFGLLTARAFDKHNNSVVLPIYDRARSFALERILLSTLPLGPLSVGSVLRALSNDPLIPNNARKELLDVNDKYFENEDRRILYDFESLGKDCSVGGMHRAFGAEPLGIWRFAGIGIDGVTEAIKTRMVGIGHPDFTRLIKADSGEYFSSDTRYHMSSHTYIFDDNGDYDRLFDRQCKKIAFLASNFLEKIRDGSRILVIHALPEDIPEVKLSLLWRTIASFGGCRLLYLRVASRANPVGATYLRRDGVIVGHVLQLQGNMMLPEAEVRAGWMSVFRRVHAHVFSASDDTLLPQKDCVTVE